MKRPGIPLHDAPERFFDQKKWRALIRMVGGRDSALALVSNYSANELAVELRKDFRRQLMDGSIVATGSVRDSPEITNMSPSRCQSLWPDFVSDRLKGNYETFIDVYVLDASQLAAAAVSPTQSERLAAREGRQSTLGGKALPQSVGKRPRIKTYFREHFPNGVPDPGHYSRKRLKAELIEWDPSLYPLDDGTLKKAIDEYNAALGTGRT